MSLACLKWTSFQQEKGVGENGLVMAVWRVLKAETAGSEQACMIALNISSFCHHGEYSTGLNEPLD